MNDQQYLYGRFRSALQCAAWCQMRGFDGRAAYGQAVRQANRLAERGFSLAQYDRETLQNLSLYFGGIK